VASTTHWRRSTTPSGTVLAELPEAASLLLAGVSDEADGEVHLHVAMATGPSFDTGRLTSASTGREGVVQLIDVAPTVLWLTGTPVPFGTVGVHWQAVPGSGAPTAQQVADLVELDERSTTARAAVGWYYPAVAWTAFLFVAATLLAWRQRRSGFLRPLGAVVAGVPVAGYLVQLVPWWRAAPGHWRRSPWASRPPWGSPRRAPPGRGGTVGTPRPSWVARQPPRSS
jgi:hypothetical protein